MMHMFIHMSTPNSYAPIYVFMVTGYGLQVMGFNRCLLLLYAAKYDQCTETLRQLSQKYATHLYNPTQLWRRCLCGTF